MIEYDIRHSANKKYIRQVMQAILDFEHEHGKGIEAKVADKVGLPPEGVFAFAPNGELLGGLTYRVYNDWVFLDYGFVWDPYRGQGIYAGLIHTLEQAARSAGLVGMEVWTYTWEAPSVYEALGFERGAVLRDFPRGNTSIEYQKYFGEA